ncbi:sigma factor-like helix-turn-helix DNA-binding protein [Sedimentibacter sp. MB31-C6]|uniref:sigma factor-like helix-turn-helix DNA-binding protein n=1 Tax=Sedimentibacter sp. MB31-C6 TaxID=3109366 RepID=UPI002DDD01FE|nr:sigma factor-like helix-turn-helix DNA-binding protein [Sedimentibacter sp. MB36-C1]WSI04598.1 sigma factor-like helix-turn-helix DNA-binding protein [Sedimentibacter sp. MB36-C1]
MDLKKFENRQDGEIINYIKRFFRSKYIDIVRQNINKHIEITAFETDFICHDCYERLEEENFYRMLRNLNSIQKKIIIGKYMYNYSYKELTKILNVSRQTIYTQKKKALQKLKKELEDD